MNNLKKSDIWKTQLRIANNFLSTTDNDEEHVMNSKSNNIEMMIGDEADKVKDFFDSLKNRYQNNLILMKGSQFVFNYVHLMYYKCHKINPNRGRSYSPDSIKDKKKQQ